MREFTTEVLFRPETEELRFLPEGPYPNGDDRLSWVAIQHGAAAKSGSLNLFEFASGSNQSVDLPGRPGFAFPTDRDGIFAIGMETQIWLFDTTSLSLRPLGDPVEGDVSGTVVNDGVVFSGGLIFGCKDLKFAEAKAGLYLWRRSDWQTIRLRSDQICSNGKVVIGDGDRVTLLDIDSPTKTIVRYELDVVDGRLSPPEIVVDLTKGDVFPDGMIATPDGAGVIVAFYNPADAEFGEAKQFSLATGQEEAVWRTEKSPRVTCPQLVERDGRIQLILTTADEGMSPEQQARHTNAGAFFIGETDFTSLPETPLFEIPQ
jgi:sugar lactone lactonase YvrE